MASQTQREQRRETQRTRLVSHQKERRIEASGVIKEKRWSQKEKGSSQA